MNKSGSDMTGPCSKMLHMGSFSSFVFLVSYRQHPLHPHLRYKQLIGNGGSIASDSLNKLLPLATWS